MGVGAAVVAVAPPSSWKKRLRRECSLQSGSNAAWQRGKRKEFVRVVREPVAELNGFLKKKEREGSLCPMETRLVGNQLTCGNLEAVGVLEKGGGGERERNGMKVAKDSTRCILITVRHSSIQDRIMNNIFHW